ncbi:MAG: four-carbon acid sugar kinase family protein [Halalkalicoccus sp.]
MPRVLVVADDLTGATDTAHAFARRGYETAVGIGPESDPPDATVLAANTDSRYADADAAKPRVRRAISGTAAEVVYGKVDSTLRGNVAAEVHGAMDCGFDRGLVAPAAPAVGRLTACGHHLVDGRPLSDTEYAEDPNGPTSARLPALFDGQGRPARHLGIETVAAVPEAVSEALADVPEGAVVTCDAVHDRHLEAVARAGREIDGRTLFVGSSGLAGHIMVPGEPDREPQSVTNDGGALGIVGSVSERSLEQLAALPEMWVIALDPAELLRNPEDGGRRAGRRAAERLAAGEHAVVTAAPDREAVERTLERGRERGLDGEEIRERVTRALSSGARAALAGEPAGLFVTGGDVAMAVFGALDAEWLSLSGEEIEAGIPASRLRGGPADGTPVVTKAGGFGREETVINCLRFLGGDDE